MLGWVPIGSVPPDSPIHGIEEDACLLMRTSFLDQLDQAGGTVRPFARLVRLSHLTIEWIRSVESRGGASQPDLRRAVYDILLLARLVDAALDMVFLETADERVEGLVGALDQARRSAPLHELAGFVGRPSLPAREPLRERLPAGRAQDTLDLLASGVIPPEPARPIETVEPPRPALDRVLLDRLGEIGNALAATGCRLGTPMPTGLFGLLEECLGEAPGGDEVRRHLLALDSACAGLHRGRAVGAPMSLEYVRISGAARSPLAKGSTFPPGVLTQFSDLVETGGRIDPRNKLSGNSLANFSAFLSRRFRANDWMWGRMDAAAGLVDILVRPDHLARGTSVGQGARGGAPSQGRGRGAGPVRLRARRRGPPVGGARVRAAVGRQSQPGPRRRQHRPRRQRRDPRRHPPAPHRPVAAGDLPGRGPRPAGGAAAARRRPRASPGPGTPRADDVATASRNVGKVMSAYERAPRRASELWGSRATTALGVRVARNLSRSLVPGNGVAAVTKRTLAAVPIMIATAALLARGAFLVACSLLLNVVLVPRMARESLFQWVVLGVSTVASLLFWAVLVRRRSGRGRWRGWVALGITLAIQAFGWTVMLWPSLQAVLAPPQVEASTPWDSSVVLGKPLVGATVVALATALAWFLLLIWAQKAWAITEAAIIGAIWGWWVIVGAWKPERDLGVFAQLQAAARLVVDPSAGARRHLGRRDGGRPHRGQRQVGDAGGSCRPRPRGAGRVRRRGLAAYGGRRRRTAPGRRLWSGRPGRGT